MRMLVAIEERLSYSLTPGAILEAPTIESLAGLIRELRSGRTPAPHGHAIHARADRPSLFIPYPLGGSGLGYRPLIEALETNSPCTCWRRHGGTEGRAKSRLWSDSPPTTWLRSRSSQPTGAVSPASEGPRSAACSPTRSPRQLAAAGHHVPLLALVDSAVGADPQAGSDPRNWPMSPTTSFGHRMSRRLWLFLATQQFRARKIARRLLAPAKRVRWRLRRHRFGAVPERRRRGVPSATGSARRAGPTARCPTTGR